MRRYALGLGIALVLACSGCSYALMRPAPANHLQLDYVACTSSRVAPVFDSVGVVEGVGMVIAVEVLDGYGVLGEGDGEVSGGGRALQVAALSASAVYLVSAIHGFSGAEECEEAKALSNLRQLEQVKARESAAPLGPRPGCQSDAECKGGRLCVAGSCTWAAPPSRQASPVPAPTPAASPSPPAP